MKVNIKIHLRSCLLRPLIAFFCRSSSSRSSRHLIIMDDDNVNIEDDDDEDIEYDDDEDIEDNDDVDIEDDDDDEKF